jgi:hypothetical protein
VGRGPRRPGEQSTSRVVESHSALRTAPAAIPAVSTGDTSLLGRLARRVVCIAMISHSSGYSYSARRSAVYSPGRRDVGGSEYAVTYLDCVSHMCRRTDAPHRTMSSYAASAPTAEACDKAAAEADVANRFRFDATFATSSDAWAGVSTVDALPA